MTDSNKFNANFSKPSSLKRTTMKNALNSTVIGAPRPRQTTEMPRTTIKDMNKAPRMKFTGNKPILNRTVTSDCNTSLLPSKDIEGDAEIEIAYSKMLSSIFAECLLDQAVEREKTEVDIQMAELAKRFEGSLAVLEKTNKRLSEISFASEHQRLLDMQTSDLSEFVKVKEECNTDKILEDLVNKEQSLHDRLDLKNVNMGYSEETGYKVLVDSINEAIEGFEDIKRKSNLDLDKLRKYQEQQKIVQECRNDDYDIKKMEVDIGALFPNGNKKLLIETSEKLAKLIKDIDGSDDEDETM